MKYISRRKILRHHQQFSQAMSLATGEVQEIRIVPGHLVIHPTKRCNLRCSHCYFSHSDDTTLEPSQLGRLAAAISSQPLVRVVNISGGGEPSLVPYIDEFIKALGNVEIGMFSNGVAIDKLGPALRRLSWLNISLDAYTPEMFAEIKGADQFQTVLENIKLVATEYRPKHGIRVSFLLYPPLLTEDKRILASLVWDLLRQDVRVRIKGGLNLTDLNEWFPKPDDDRFVVQPSYAEYQLQIPTLCHAQYVFPVVDNHGRMACSCNVYERDPASFFTSSLDGTIEYIKNGIPASSLQCRVPKRDYHCISDRYAQFFTEIAQSDPYYYFL